MSSVRYAPGAGVALLGRQTWALLRLETSHPTVTALWPAVASGKTLRELLDLLLVDGLGALPDLALVSDTSAGVRVIVRGSAVVESEDGQLVTAPDLLTWHEVVLSRSANCLTMSFSTAAAPDHDFPSGGGVVLADVVRVVLGEETPQASAALPVEQPVVAEKPAAAGEVAVEEVDEHTLTFVGAEPESPGQRAEQPEQVPPLAVASLGTSYDFLFEQTTRRPDELPALDRPPVLSEPVPPVLPLRAPAPAQTQAVGEAPVAQQPPPPAPAGLISAVPWAGASAVPPVPAAPLAPQLEEVDEADEKTLRRGDVQALLQQAAPAVPTEGAGPLVHAVSCSAGHLNDPQSGICRRCGKPLEVQDPVTVPRPVLGVLAMSNGESVVLDRDVLIGRGPSTDVEGAARPHLVKLNNPSGDISRNHVTVVLDGWHVLVKDLGSKNGTVVALPGQAPELLREQVAQPIVPGTRVSLADDVSFVFEVVV